MLDNMVIGEGEFTTEFFNRTDWRDMLGDQLGQEIGGGRRFQAIDREPVGAAAAPTAGKEDTADVLKAFEAAEDEEDAAAAHAAAEEDFVDNPDFSEIAVQPTIGEDGEVLPPPKAASPVPDDDGEAATKAMAEAAADEDEQDLEGTIDGYMLKYARLEWEDWFEDF